MVKIVVKYSESWIDTVSIVDNYPSITLVSRFCIIILYFLPSMTIFYVKVCKKGKKCHLQGPFTWLIQIVRNFYNNYSYVSHRVIYDLYVEYC